MPLKTKWLPQIDTFLLTDNDFSLRFGAIPILALEQGVNANAYLPFSEVLDWNKAAIITTTKALKVRLLINCPETFLIHNMNTCRRHTSPPG